MKGDTRRCKPAGLGDGDEMDLSIELEFIEFRV